jgi:hypothetical protein
MEIKEILGAEKSLELTSAIDQIPISSTLFDGTLNQDQLDVLKPVQSIPLSPKMLAEVVLSSLRVYVYHHIWL